MRLFSVTTTGVTLTLDNIALTSGHTSATYGGAVFLTSGALVVNNARFDGNTSATAGGAIGANGPTPSDSSSITVSNSLFTSNSTLIGGAIYADSATVNVSASTLRNDLAHDQQQHVHPEFRHRLGLVQPRRRDDALRATGRYDPEQPHDRQ